MKNIMVVGIIAVLFLLFLVPSVSADWSSGWDYRKTITLTGEAGAGTHYQVNLSIGNSSGGDFHLEGHCTDFPNDTVVTDDDGVTKLPFWIENASADPIRMWINVSDNLNTSQDVCVYYGKSGEGSARNGTNTFEFFENIEARTNGDKLADYGWTWNGIGTDNGIYTNEKAKYGTLSMKHIEHNNNYYRNPNLSLPIVFDYWVYTTSTSGTNVDNWVHLTTSNCAVVDGYDSTTWRLYTNAGYVTSSTPLVVGWHHVIVRIAADGSATVDVDGTELNVSFPAGDMADPMDQILMRTYNSGVGYLDSLFARKYASPEPAYLSAGAEESAPSGPNLNIGNIQNFKYDWGRDWDSNFSANVTIANASNVWMNFTNAEFTNTSLGNLNLTLDEWVNESHNVNAPVINISITVTLKSTTSNITNDTDTFWYEITKRSNTATMDSPATQAKSEGENFYINATCNEEYGDTFYGAADLLEDGFIIDTDATVINYVNFSHNEGVVGVYNYTVRFYNTTYYDNATTPTYSNVTISLAPFNTAIYKGYNLVGYTGVGGGSAEVLVTDIGHSNYITLLEKSASDYFRTHTKGFTINNFTTEHGYGYYLFATSESAYERAGFLSFSYDSTLKNGWNIIGWTNSTGINAEQLSNLVGSNCSYVADLNPTIHTKGFSGNNFNVVRGRAYFVHVNKDMEWGRDA